MIAETIVPVIKKNGGEVVKNCGVDKIWIENAKSKGVILEDGSKISSDIVISSAGVANTLTKFLRDEKSLKNYQSNMKEVKPSSGHACLYIGFDKSAKQLGIKDTNMILPLGLLHDGATLHEANGSDIEVGDGGLDALCQAVSNASRPVIDARDLGDSSVWWKATFRSVKQRTGIDMSRQTIEIEARPYTTLGGVTVDESGRAILSTWSRWFTGLYAAGEASCSGFHGADFLPGNHMLDALLGGAAAGAHAGDWVKHRKFANAQAAHEAEQEAQALEQEASDKADEAEQKKAQEAKCRAKDGAAGLASQRRKELKKAVDDASTEVARLEAAQKGAQTAFDADDSRLKGEAENAADNERIESAKKEEVALCEQAVAKCSTEKDEADQAFQNAETVHKEALAGKGTTDTKSVSEQRDLGVPLCRDAFTPSMRVVSRRGGRGWFLF